MTARRDRDRQVIKRAQLAITPMIDVVFLLLIFFMVGMKFREQDRKVEANLPKEGPPPTTEPGELIGEIWIFIQTDHAAGHPRPRILVDQRLMKDWDELDAVLGQLARTPRSTLDDVILAPADDALHEWVMRTLDRVRRHGFAKIRFKR